MENNGTLDIEKRIMKDNLIVAKPDMWLVNGSKKAIEIESKVPQKRKVKNKTKRLKSNGADHVILAIAYNPDTEARTLKRIEKKRLSNHCDQIILVDYTNFENLIDGQTKAENLIKIYEKKNDKIELKLPESRKTGNKTFGK